MYLITTKKLNEVVLLGIGNVLLQNLSVFHLFDWGGCGFCWRWNLYFVIWALDTHTFKVSQRLGLLKRKTYDMKASIELTQRLKKFDSLDPIKYDFALYRLGQEKLQ